MRATFGVQVLVLGVILSVLVYAGWAISARVIYRQEAQPIAFRHDLMAGKRQIACQYCHRGVYKGDIAGVPSVPECMDCHNVVRGQAAGENAAEVDKLLQYWGNGKDPKSIQWFKVWKMPKHVRFTHSAHVKKSVACETCHGNVKEMQVMTQANNPIMGWCVTCHRKPEYNAPTDCTTCHK